MMFSSKIQIMQAKGLDVSFIYCIYKESLKFSTDSYFQAP